MDNLMLSRRRLIGGACALGGTALIGSTATAALPERRLAIRNVHNNERYDACFFKNGRFNADGMAELNHALRDWRTGQSRTMDPKLIELLTALRDRVGLNPAKSIDLISGYRSPATNASLRARGGAHTGVARQSQHMLGTATDIAIPGVRLADLRTAALGLGRGGVGYYPRDGFVHVDTGAVRSW